MDQLPISECNVTGAPLEHLFQLTLLPKESDGFTPRLLCDMNRGVVKWGHVGARLQKHAPRPSYQTHVC